MALPPGATQPVILSVTGTSPGASAVIVLVVLVVVGGAVRYRQRS